MTSEQDGAVAAIREAACGELNAGMRKIHHCLAQLTDEQVWWRPADDMNAIGNLLLHLCGNVRQWIVSGVGGAEDVRRRWEEFQERTPISKTELLSRLDATVAEANAAMQQLPVEAFAAKRKVQGNEVTAAQAIFHSVAHFWGHVQEIVHMTRTQLGEAYRFDFVPKSPEQGRPSSSPRHS